MIRFEKKDDHYLDNKTGFKWSLENFGPMTWNKTIQQFSQNSKWRLPTIEELIALVDYELIEPATELPDMMSSYYWSSTTNVSYTCYAWSVHFGYGYSNYYSKDYSRYIRAICGEEDMSNE